MTRASKALFALILFAAPASPQVTLKVDGQTICPTSAIRYELDARELVVTCDNAIFGDGFGD